MSVLAAKIREMERHSRFLLTHLQNARSQQHPHLQKRCELLLDDLKDIDLEGFAHLADAVENLEFSGDIKVWNSIYRDIINQSADLQKMRLQEIPALTSTDPQDNFMTNILIELHREMGLNEIFPGVSLTQGLWFAVTTKHETYPCYFLPRTLLQDVSELPLVYHEIGHVLLGYFDGMLAEIEQVVISHSKTIRQTKLQAMDDPGERKKYSEYERQILIRQRVQLQELACDVIATLICGPAYAIALHIGLWTAGRDPYKQQGEIYPPRDYRLRACQIGLQTLGQLDIADRLSRNWQIVLNNAEKPALYDWEYDDNYLIHLIEIVKRHLLSRNVALYGGDSAKLCKALNDGLQLMLENPEEHEKWNRQTLTSWSSRFG